jgi:hypothetical protein
VRQYGEQFRGRAAAGKRAARRSPLLCSDPASAWWFSRRGISGGMDVLALGPPDIEFPLQGVSVGGQVF